ncbi:MAG: hypothetical protein FJX77_17660 [Armatimonadetes bacterium]|nr:hypothetical protein [Armatimonadota bacterium]
MAVERYLVLHPAAPLLEQISVRIRQREQPASGESAASPRPGVGPETVAQPFPVPDDPWVPWVRPEPDPVRMARETREEFALRRRAEPDRAEARYIRELERLRRRYLEQRDFPVQEDLEREQQLATAYAEKSAQLQREVDALVERPSDRFFYGAEGLRQRRLRLLEFQDRLDRLRTEEIERLRRRLEPPPRRALQIPPALLREAAAERDRLRRESAAELDQQEQARLDAERALVLPEPAVAGSPFPASSVELADEPWESRLAETRGVAPREAGDRPGGPVGGAAGAALRTRQESLRNLMLADLRAVALQAARGKAWKIRFQPGEGPDLTARLEPEVRRLLREPHGNGRGENVWGTTPRQ